MRYLTVVLAALLASPLQVLAQSSSSTYSPPIDCSGLSCPVGEHGQYNPKSYSCVCVLNPTSYSSTPPATSPTSSTPPTTSPSSSTSTYSPPIDCSGLSCPVGEHGQYNPKSYSCVCVLNPTSYSSVGPTSTSSTASSAAPSSSSSAAASSTTPPVSLTTIITPYLNGTSTIIETITTITTLTTCPASNTCTGQTLTWTYTNGPFPCTAHSTCTCVLPGGTITISTCPPSITCTGQTTHWTSNAGPTSCPASVTCNAVLPSQSTPVPKSSSTAALVAGAGKMSGGVEGAILGFVVVVLGLF